jgi:hypothetical protein
MMDHAAGRARQERHAQSIEHQSRAECGGHRPADDPPAVVVDHHSEINMVAIR